MPPLPIFATPSSETRLISEHWRRTLENLRETVACTPGGRLYWTGPKGSDVFADLETQKANRLLEKGATVDYAAERLAFAIVARTYGTAQTERALRLTALIDAPKPSKPATLDASTAQALAAEGAQLGRALRKRIRKMWAPA